MIEYLVKKRKITLFFFVVVALYGLASFFMFPTQELPDFAVNTAVVTTVLPGADPEKVEQTITKKLEEKIKEIQGLKTINSYSKSQVSVIVIETKNGIDPKTKWDELRKKIKDAESELPKEAKTPTINDDVNRMAIDTLNITADTREQLYDLRDTIKSFKEQYRTLPNVADVTTIGLPEQEIRIEADAAKLSQYNIPWTQVVGSVQKDIEKVPLGNLDTGDLTYELKVSDSKDIDSLKSIVISLNPEGIPIRLGDVSTVTLTTEKVENFVYHNGKPAVSISISCENGTDVPTLHKNITELSKQLSASLPANVKLENVYSQNERIDDLFGKLKRETFVAIIAVILVCSLGLNLITSLVIALAIPISLFIGLLCTTPFDITLNMISMVSLIIVLGILVDDAVVVNDNIERRLTELKESPFTASIQGTKEVFFSILTATLATICSFGPIAFLQGNVGTFIKPLPLIISASMLVSMIMSLTIVPIFREWYEKRNNNRNDYSKSPGLLGKKITGLTYWYSQTLMPKILKRPLFIGLMAILISTLAYCLIPLIPIEIFPNAIRPEMLIDITATYGVSVDETNNITLGVTRWLQKQPGVTLLSSYVGCSAPNVFRADMGAGNGSNIGQIIVKINGKKYKTSDLLPKWQRELKEMYPQAIITPKELKMGPPVGEPVVVKISGGDIEKLRELSLLVKEKISGINGTYKIEDDIGIDRYAIEFETNKELMDKKMVKYDSVTSTIRLASDGIDVTKFDNGKDLINIKMYCKNDSTDPNLVFSNLSVTSMTGQQIPLSEIAQIKPSFGIKQIPHKNLWRTVTITSNVEGKTATQVMNELKPKLSQITLPDGYRLETAGETSEQNDIFKDLSKLLIVAIFLIIILISIQFYSLSLPLLVMSTVYLAFAGSLVGLFITRTPLGFMSAMGAICLVGIVVRNGIVLIEFIENERKTGIDLKQAVINAGKARLRPVLLTASTAIAGLLSLAFSDEMLFRALAITIIFGLFYSTVSTLVVVPAFYTAMAQYFDKRIKKE